MYPYLLVVTAIITVYITQDFGYVFWLVAVVYLGRLLDRPAETAPKVSPARPVIEPAGTFLPKALPAHIRRLLEEAGYHSIEAVRRADDAELLSITGINPAILNKIREVTSY